MEAEVIDLFEDEDDEELSKALEASLNEYMGQPRSVRPSSFF